MSKNVWIDGALVDAADAKVGVYDHGLLYGDGVFEGIRIYNGRVFEQEAHLKRLYESAKSIRLTIPYISQQLVDAIHQTRQANDLTDCYIRLVVTRGIGALGISPARCKTPSVFIITDMLELYPQEFYQKGMAVIVSSITRTSANMLPPRVKSLNYLNNILAKIEAIDANVPEAIMLNAQGNVAEATADNIFVIKDGVVMTPPASDGALEGITRGVVIKLCQRMNVPIVEKTLQRHDLYIADEMFLSGTGAELIPVTKVDGRTVHEGLVGPLTQKLFAAFRKYIVEG